ncbi:heterogeneous nuclear ribonucleoprotein L2 [Pelomyxa schiedti]|nr:heterogeneous nuclear ribonucleoprotein L2 [Pelomyxa schiedti]
MDDKKLDIGDRGEPTASKVIHVRNVISESMNEDLTAFASQFGRVLGICNLAKFNQALLEMDSVSAATNLVNYARNNPVLIRERELHFTYSKSQQINQPAKPPPAPNRILLFTILNPVYNITVDVLYTITSPYGGVQRIVVFNKNGVQALVEFDTPHNAQAAKQALEGKDIYAGSCTLKIEFSRAEKLNVQTNTDKTRDYVNPNIPTGTIPYLPGVSSSTSSSSSSGALGLSSSQLGYGIVDPNMAAAQAQAAAMDFYRSFSESKTVLMVYNVEDRAFTPDHLFNLFCIYGNVLKIKCLPNKRGAAMVQMQDNPMAEAARTYLNGATVFTQQLQISYSRHPFILPGHADGSGENQDTEMCKDYTNSPFNRFKSANQTRHVYRPSHNVYFNNIPPEVTEEMMISVFQNAGAPLPVQVKFFVSKPSIPPTIKDERKEGLLEFADPSSATEAIVLANNSKQGVPLFKIIQFFIISFIIAFKMTMKFCAECNNMLYPKEDREGKKLLFACRFCDHVEEANEFCVYRNEIIHSAEEKATVLHDVISDPTLPRTNRRCEKCGNSEAVFFQASHWTPEGGMKLFFVCTNASCQHKWVD